MSVQQLESLYVFAVWMLGQREAAFEAVWSVLEQTPDPTRQLPALVAMLTEHRRSSSGINRFAALDDLLRTNTTVPVDLNHPLVLGDPQRLAVLLSELQRTCLLTTVRGLPPQRRAVFILLHVMNLPVETCAAVCESNPGAVRTMDIRGRKIVEDYLTTRCEHMDRGNSCHCIARLGGALEQRFIAWPHHDDHADASLAPRAPHGEIRALYASLPRVRLPVLA